MNKLNLGCGTDYREGYVNLDINPKLKTDICYDLNQYPWEFKDNEFDEILAGSNILGFVDDFTKAMEEIHRIAKNGCLITITGPIFPSVNCFSDPYTKKIFTFNSFVYYYDKEGILEHYVKPKFDLINRKIIVMTKFPPFNFLANLYPKFYIRFWSSLIYPEGMEIVLEKSSNELNNTNEVEDDE